jgi:hypothetical protein
MDLLEDDVIYKRQADVVPVSSLESMAPLNHPHVNPPLLSSKPDQRHGTIFPIGILAVFGFSVYGLRVDF